MVTKHSGPKIGSEERELFRREMAGVRPISGQPRQPTRAAPPPPEPRMTKADVQAIMDELRDGPLNPEHLDTGEEQTHRQPGVQESVLRKLRRGRYSVQAELDLHGLTSPAAKLEVVRFLQEARRRSWRCVRIIHGKGHRSGQGGPVLKQKVAHWLRQRQDVLAFSSARPVDGGSGAVYVLLRSDR